MRTPAEGESPACYLCTRPRQNDRTPLTWAPGRGTQWTGRIRTPVLPVLFHLSSTAAVEDVVPVSPSDELLERDRADPLLDVRKFDRIGRGLRQTDPIRTHLPTVREPSHALGRQAGAAPDGDPAEHVPVGAEEDHLGMEDVTRAGVLAPERLEHRERSMQVDVGGSCKQDDPGDRGDHHRRREDDERPGASGGIDVLVAPPDADRALEALAAAGFETEKTDPSWIYKAVKDGVLVDVIFKVKAGVYLDDEVLSRVHVREYRGRRIRLVSPEDAVVIEALSDEDQARDHWFNALAIVAAMDLDWDYLERRARYGTRRVLSLLLYAQSNDYVVP